MLLRNLDDHQLVNFFIDNNSQAFDVLMQRHKVRVFSFIMSKVKDEDLANDIFQDTFFKAINSLKKGKYNEEGKFLPWIMRIAHNLVIDHFRRLKRMPKANVSSRYENFDIFDVIDNNEDSKEKIMLIDDQTEQLRMLVGKLPEDQRQVLIMRHYEELSFKEIAEKTGVSINTALGRMRYALINLRKMLTEHNIDLTI